MDSIILDQQARAKFLDSATARGDFTLSIPKPSARRLGIIHDRAPQSPSMTRFKISYAGNLVLLSFPHNEEG